MQTIPARPKILSPVLGRLTFGAAIAGTVLGVVHALAYYATTGGSDSLKSPLVHWWAAPAARTFHLLLGWGSPHTVYLSYGKVWLLVIAAATVCAFAVRRTRHPVGLERWGWSIALTGYVLATVSSFGEYWTPWIDQAFFVLSLPAVVLSVVGSMLLGIALLRRGFRPRSTAWLLATWLVSLVAVDSVLALGAAVLPMVWAWGLAGRRMSVPAPERESVPVAQ